MSNCLSDGPRYERDGAAVEAGLDAFLQVGRQFLLVSRHLFLMAILARARIGLLLFGHRCFSPYSCLLGCPRMPGYPTRETLRTHCNHVCAPRCGARASAATGIRRRRSRMERGAAMPGPRAPVPHVRARPERTQRPEIAADHALLLASDCDRLASPSIRRPKWTIRASTPRGCADVRFPRAEAGVYAPPWRSCGSSAVGVSQASAQATASRRQQHSASFTGPLRVRRASAEMAHPTRAAGSPMSCAENISGGES